jgi:hypothetical protein
VACATAALLPEVASAHGIVGKQDLPIPRWLFAWAAAVVLVASFVGLAALWPRPRLEDVRIRLLLHVPRLLEGVCGLVGVAVYALVVYAGFAGTQTATANIVPTFVFVLFWVGIPFLSLVLGDVFRPFNPWRAVGRATGWLAARMRGGEELAPMPYPAWLGRWPAAAGVLAFAWVELVYVNKDDPSTLSVLILAYTAAQLVGMSLYGVERWSRNGDAFAVYFAIFARLAPLRLEGGALRLRPPLTGAPPLDPRPGTVALLCTMIGTTSFDGFSNGQLWSGPSGMSQHLVNTFVRLGFNQEAALEGAYTVGLLMMVALVSAVFWLGISGMRSVGGGRSTGDLAQRFVHTLIPIASAYVVAHYFSLLAYQGQATAYLISDPLGHGSNLFGTASATIDYNVVSATGIWYVQVAALVIGHVCGLILAHDRALATWSRPSQATRSQYWMLAVMVGFTSLGLWILSAAAQ